MTYFQWLFVCAMWLGTAWAQDGRGPGRGRFPGGGMGFSTLDLNGDGVLDAQEIEAAPRTLAKLDQNGDGQITADEVRPRRPEGGGRGPGGRGGEREAPSDVSDDTVKMLMSFDKNGDGKLSRDELPERFQGIFDRADTNHDGFLTPEEIRTAARSQAQGPEGGERREGPGRGEMNFIKMDPVLAAIDTDGDGVLSAAEIRNAAVSLRKLDKNQDGQITRDEAMPAGGRREMDRDR